MPSIFPDDLDTDLEIPRVDQNVTEISGDVINSLRDAIFAMQKAIGINGPGNKPSLVERISVSIDEDGNINKDALASIGLVTLPIVNKHIGDTAGIVESKLKLDFSTQSLKNSIESVKTDVGSSQAGLSTTISSLNTHILGIGNFHDGYHIKINSPGSPQIGVSGLEALTVGDAINELVQILITGNDTTIQHIDGGLPVGLKHAAQNIAINASNFTTIDRTSTTVQEALDSIDEESGALGTSHLDEFHSNGILKTISSGSTYNSNKLIYSLSTGAYYDEGTSIITIPGVTSFLDLGIKTGDLIKISGTGLSDSGTYQIRTVGPLSGGDTLGWLPTLAVDQLAIFHTFTESRATNDTVSVSVYGPASVSSEYAPLSCSVRHNATVADSICVLNPNAARVVSIGFNNSILNSDGYEIGIKAGVGPGEYRNIIIPNLNRFRLSSGQAHPVTAASVAERINAYVSDPDLNIHMPISAYRIGNEICIAHNWVGQDYTIEIVDGYTGNYALGLDSYGANVVGLAVVGNENNAYVVNGVARSDIRTAFDGYAEVTSNSSTLLLYDNNGNIINPLRFGIRAGSVMHIYDHPVADANGSYTLFYANSVSVFTFSNEPIVADESSSSTRFNVMFTDSSIALNELYGSETDKGIVQIYIDSSGRTLLHDRLAYGNNLGSSIEIVDVSQNFPIGSITLSVTSSVDHYSFSLVDNSLSGESVSIHEDFDGKLKLYHPNNVDYITIDLIPGTLSSGVQGIIVKQIPVLDEAMELCNAHYDGSLSITNLVDTRLFGSLSSNEVRDDFIELFSQRQVSDLRSNGVVRGFDLLDIPFIDDLSLMQALPIRGGTSYINGVRVTTETQKVIIPAYDSEGILLNNVRRIVGINEFGTIQAYSDELGEILSDGYSSSVKFGKILPLYRLELVNGGISNIVDLRLFINNLDEKIDIIVDETNNVVGNFRTLEGALAYAESYPGAEKLTVRIINTVNPPNPIVVPRGVSLIGGTQFGGSGRYQIIAPEIFNDKFITLSGDNRIENLEVSAYSSFNNSLLFINGSNVSIKNCLLQYDYTIGTNSGNVAVEIGESATLDIRIIDNKIRNVFSGIVGLHGFDKSIISGNEIDELSGTGGISIGISIGTISTPVGSLIIDNNTIKVPDLANDSDVRGIQIDVLSNL